MDMKLEFIFLQLSNDIDSTMRMHYLTLDIPQHISINLKQPIQDILDEILQQLADTGEEEKYRELWNYYSYPIINIREI